MMNCSRALKLLLILLFTMSFSMVMADGALAAGNCSNEDMLTLFEPGEVTGSATMCTTKSGLKAQMRVQGLMPGGAYTVWWVYYDDAANCIGGFPDVGMCGFADFGGDKPNAVFGRFGSVVVPASGNAHFGDTLNGMVPSSGSEVWLLIFGHGPAASGAALARQLLTPEDPNVGAPHLGNVVDGTLGYPAATTVHYVD